MIKFYLLILIFLSTNINYSQNFSIHYFQPVTANIDSPNWGNDVLISSSEPMGRMSGVEKSNGNIYVSVPDTNIYPGQEYGIIIYVSSNHGASWSALVGLHPAFVCGKTKMICTGLDSVVCFFWYGSSVYNWNVLNGRFSPVSSGPLKEFDVAATSTGGLYVFADTLNGSSHNAIRKGSTDGGISWPNFGTVENNAAKPHVSKSYSGDTLFLNYYSPVLADTATSTIRQGRYRETSIGVISAIDFINIVTGTDTKPEFATIAYQNIVWFFNTMGTTGSIDIVCRVSFDNGGFFNYPFTVAGGIPNVDEYWFDVKFHTAYDGGVDLIYYRDSLQNGNPNVNSDKLMYTWAAAGTPNGFTVPAKIDNTNFPGWSSRLYIPSIIEYFTMPDMGAIWVGSDGTNKRIFSNRLFDVIGVSNKNHILPEKYSLSQNYPNPFNPTTIIKFRIKDSRFVTLKVFNILGKEIATLVNEKLQPGTYEIPFSINRFPDYQLPSGVYFYKITAGNFSNTKKMILLK